MMNKHLYQPKMEGGRAHGLGAGRASRDVVAVAFVRRRDGGVGEDEGLGLVVLGQPLVADRGAWAIVVILEDIPAALTEMGRISSAHKVESVCRPWYIH